MIWSRISAPLCRAPPPRSRKWIFTARGGLDGDRLVGRGLGARYPVMSNITAAGRTENRRVVIIVSPDDTRPATPAAPGAVR